MSEAEEKKLEVARKDQDEEIPAWADAMAKSHKTLMDRLDALEKPREAADSKGEDPTENTEGQRKDESEDEKKASGEKALAAKESKDGEPEKAAKEEAKAEKTEAKDSDKDREDRARHDASRAENRQLAAKIQEMEARIHGLYKEPSFEDRNALSAARARADNVFQALTGQPPSEPIPGEPPIQYRKRLADAIRKHSPRFKEHRIDALTGPAFELAEETIYADAHAAARSPEITGPGQLRKITRQDSGHTITEYIGDTAAAWAPFTAGAGVTARLSAPHKH